LVLVRSPDDARLRDLLLKDGIEVSSPAPGQLEVTGVTSDEIGRRASGGRGKRKGARRKVSQLRQRARGN
jgi:hypothetical protein